jgi:hypothetical protein
MNCCLAKNRKKVFLPGNQMTERLYQLRTRPEDGLEICRAQSQEQAGAESRESGIRSHTGQKRYLTKGVTGTQLCQFEFSTVLRLMGNLNNATENELNRLRYRSLR